jgi:class 3 adenylate cyclase
MATNETRLFLEEICCELARARHIDDDRLTPGDVVVDREVALGRDGFADIVVAARSRAPYAIEVKTGCGGAELVALMGRKYGEGTAARGLDRVVLVVDRREHALWDEVETRLRACVRSGLGLEVRDLAEIGAEVALRYGVATAAWDEATLLGIRRAIDRAKWRHIYGPDEPDPHLLSPLLWHFGPWTLERLLREQGLGPDDVLKPGSYRDVGVLMVDLSGFSGYVRDTADERVVRDALTAFYSHARFAIHAAGGMVYQFIGDSVVGLFGVPTGRPDDAERAVQCARRLGAIGRAVARGWQARIDLVQKAQGVHVGLSMGELTLVPQRPLSQTHVGFVGDGLNVAARLLGEAGNGEMVIGNTVYRRLPIAAQDAFSATPDVEARNVGRIIAWRGPLEPGA